MLRRAAVAGSWYPGTPRALEQALDACLAEVAPHSLSGPLLGLVAPHAGLIYSGVVAAHAYALLKGQRDRTVILAGPSHRLAFEGVAVFAEGEFETPLGRIPVDGAAARALLSEPLVVDWPAPHVGEHSLEMQLPFLQRLVPGLRIVPCLLGSQSRDESLALGRVLARAAREHGALLVASSDLSHYHPAPAARRLDTKVVSLVERLDGDGLMDQLEAFHGHACGGGAIVAVMSACCALGATRATVLRYADSGDAGEHDKSRVVGYLAAAFEGPAAC